jgi:protein-S-isoprenylcysteine O-methyltransferase Ste14
LSISLLWRILFYGWTASEVCLVIVTRTRKSGGTVRDRGSLFILWGTIVGSIFAAGWIHDNVQAPMFAGAHWPRYVALSLMVAGLAIRWTAILSLGKAISVNVAIRTSQTLYQSGLYRLARHPSYSGVLMCIVAIGLVQRNWIGAAVVIVPTTTAVLYRIHVEEAALKDAFGAQYQAYCRTARRLIPGIY